MDTDTTHTVIRTVNEFKKRSGHPVTAYMSMRPETTMVMDWDGTITLRFGSRLLHDDGTAIVRLMESGWAEEGLRKAGTLLDRFDMNFHARRPDIKLIGRDSGVPRVRRQHTMMLKPTVETLLKRELKDLDVPYEVRFRESKGHWGVTRMCGWNGVPDVARFTFTPDLMDTSPMFIRATVAHEAAHALVGGHHGHDAPWDACRRRLDPMAADTADMFYHPDAHVGVTEDGRAVLC